MRNRFPRLLRRALLLAATLILAWLARESGLVPALEPVDFSVSSPQSEASPPVPDPAVESDADPPLEDVPDPIGDAFATRRSGFFVTVDAAVVKRLPDDREGDRHQRFLIRLPSGRTLLVAHNIDLAERAPVAVGSRIRVRGEYEWNERGGLLHWTHRAPRGDREGGWIEVAGQRVD